MDGLSPVLPAEWKTNPESHRELSRTQAFNPFAEFFAGLISRGALGHDTHEFQTIRTQAAKSLDGQRQAVLRMVDNRQNATSQVVMSGPKMQQRLRTVAAHFPGKGGKRSDTRTVFTQFHGTGGSQRAQICFKLVG